MEKYITDHFGNTIAFLLPGFVTVCELQRYYGRINSWFNSDFNAASSISSAVYIILFSLAMGIIISAIRWIVFDRGLLRNIDNKFSRLDYSKLQANLSAYQGIVEAHYRFYQFYANMAISILICSLLLASFLITHYDKLGAIVVIEILLFWAAKGCFDKTYNKIKDILK